MGKKGSGQEKKKESLGDCKKKDCKKKRDGDGDQEEKVGRGKLRGKKKEKEVTERRRRKVMGIAKMDCENRGAALRIKKKQRDRG